MHRVLRRRVLLDSFTVQSLLPNQVAGLSLWLDASDISTLFQDTGATTPVTTNGQSVARMNDKSGAGNNVTQATGTAMPTYQTNIQNGLPALSFDAGDHLNTAGTLNSFPITILGVARTNATTAVQRGVISLYHTTNFGSRIILTASDLINATVATPTSTRGAPVAVPANTPFMFGYIVDSANIYAIRDWSLSAPLAHTATPVANIVRVGGSNVNNTSSMMNGHIMEVALYTTALSGNQAMAVGRYLNKKWGIP